METFGMDMAVQTVADYEVRRKARQSVKQEYFLERLELRHRHKGLDCL